MCSNCLSNSKRRTKKSHQMSTFCPVQGIRSYFLRIFDRCRNQGTKDEIFCSAIVMRWKLMAECVVHSLPGLSLSDTYLGARATLGYNLSSELQSRKESKSMWGSEPLEGSRFIDIFKNLTGQEEEHYHNSEPNLKRAVSRTVLLGHLYFPPLDVLLQAQSNATVNQTNSSRTWG